MDLKAQLDIEDIKSLLNLFSDKEFHLLFQRMLEVYCSTSVTGISQILEKINFKTHERLINLESPYSEELEQLGVSDNFNEFLFLFYTFKDLWHQLFYETANNFVGELLKESCAQHHHPIKN
ncbi:unnamed protein product [Rhizophagus irregularis]|nr:unnamed protein product [Rhizophagus irregularis]CAB4433785.1 unnamed protein product [Rhizophagus irregularis]